MALFEEIHKAGNTIVVVTHEPDIAEHMERVVRLIDGVVASDDINTNMYQMGIEELSQSSDRIIKRD